MSTVSDNLSKFRTAYLDYVEGNRTEPPSRDSLNDKERRVAEAFIESTAACAGIDPYASRPSLERLLAGLKQTEVTLGVVAAEGPLPPPDSLTTVARLKRIRAAVPLKEIRSRGWISDTDDIDETEAAVCQLLEITSPGEKPGFMMAARRSQPHKEITTKQTAWLGRVRRLAEQQTTPRFNTAALKRIASALPREVQNGPQSLHRLPGLLAGCGVRLVFLEGLQGGKLDGAASFLPGGKLVIGLTTRWDRFDSLLYTLLHECAHLTLGHINNESAAIFDDLSTESTDAYETAADNQASNWLFPGGFKLKHAEKTRIEATAKHYAVHPSCVIGRLQHDTGNWRMHRGRIPKCREELQAASLLS